MFMLRPAGKVCIITAAGDVVSLGKIRKRDSTIREIDW